MRGLICLGLLLMAMVSGAGGQAPAVWPQWRGPDRTGLIVAAPWPETLTGDTLTKGWRVNLGPSYSGPIVAPDRVFVTETVDQKEEMVRALDRRTGKELWRARWSGSIKVPFFARSNGDWIRSTPAYDGRSLFVAGIRDLLVSLDAQTGRENWRVDFVQQFNAPPPAFGFVCSPLVTEDAVYVQAGLSFAKVDKATGKVLWRVLQEDNSMFGSAFSSPFIIQIAGRPVILVQTRTKLCGVDPTDGKVLWQQPIEADRGMNILTPTLYEGGLFTSAYGGKSQFFNLVQREGQLSLAEKWHHKSQAYMSTPVVINGYAYLHLRNQRIMCYDLRTGKEMWTTGKPFGKYWSMVANGDKILALDERGTLYLLRANPDKFDLISERKVSDSDAWAHLAVCGEELFVRDLQGLTVHYWKAR